MKKYFTKYLSVEGEIKEGDNYLFKGKFDVATKDVLEEIKQKSEGYTKCKLFLCNRDIQVGDRARIMGHAFTSDLEIEQVVNDIIRFSTKEFIVLDQLKGDVFKVIGEISPEATWVKERDEFDESEWQLCVKDDYNKWLPVDKRADWSQQENTIRIKCSQCNTYH